MKFYRFKVEFSSNKSFVFWFFFQPIRMRIKYQKPRQRYFSFIDKVIFLQNCLSLSTPSAFRTVCYLCHLKAIDHRCLLNKNAMMYVTNKSQLLLIIDILNDFPWSSWLFEKSIVFYSFSARTGQLGQKLIIFCVGTKVFMMTNSDTVFVRSQSDRAGEPQGRQES